MMDEERIEEENEFVVPDIVFFIQNQLREINDVFESHKESLVTSYLTKDVIEGISKKIVGVSVLYTLLLEVGFDQKEALEVAAIPIYKELSKAYLLKGYKGFLAKLLKQGMYYNEEEKEFEGEKRSWGWFKK